MNIYEKKINSTNYENTNYLHKKIKITRKELTKSSNEQSILDFLSELNLDIHFEKTTQNNSFIIGKAEMLNKMIILTQIDDEYKNSLEEINNNELNNIQNEEEEEEEDEKEAIEKPKPKKSEKRKETFENSIAYVNHDSLHELLRKYKHYQDEDSFKLPLDDSFFLNNKKSFLLSIQKKLNTYLKQRENDGITSCDSSDKSSGFSPLIHQDIVKQYLNSTTPYRGLLLFHGLGSGKTCTSIGIIEAMKQTKQKIFILTPASLRKNYQTQMMFCGSDLFRKTENWEFVEYPDDETRSTFIEQVNKLTGLPLEYLKKKNGVYLINKSSFNNNNSNIDEKELDEQIRLMISNRFKFISYNGISKDKWNKKYKKGNKNYNPFNHSVVIIDEGHNFVSRILNKLNQKQSSVSTEMYRDLKYAEDCNVVVLSGTPLINYPSELGIMFNIIGGSNTLIEIACKHKNPKLNTKTKIEQILSSTNTIDHVLDYKDKSPKLSNKNFGLLRILKNPYGFLKNKDGKIHYDFENASLLNVELQKKIEEKLKQAGYIIDHKYKKNIERYNKFPETEIEFNKEYLPNGKYSKKELFQNKLVGYVSYIGDKRELMPNVIVPNNDEGDYDDKLYNNDEIFIEEIVMTNYCLKGYAYARSIEKEMERSMSKSSKLKDKQTSSYQIFSRSACNFVFPENIERPYPKSKDKMSEDDLEVYNDEEKSQLPDGRYDVPNEKETKNKKLKDYKESIENVLLLLKKEPEKYFESSIEKLVNQKSTSESSQSVLTNKLSLYSPKFERILGNLLNVENNGLHLLYSNFRTLEGIGIFKILLDYYGYTEFKIKKDLGIYKLDIKNPYYNHMKFISKKDKKIQFLGRKFYALYTGKENEEDKEIIRNIFNGNLDKIPPSLRDDIVQKFFNGDYKQIENKVNLYGELIQLLIISSSGAEGIDLKNVRFVHIMEPYWHPVRIDQVIGRARRICSHKDLPEEEQTVKVFMYLLVHNQTLLSGAQGGQFTGLREVQDFDKQLKRAITTDERLYNIMLRKKRVMEEFLTSLKISAIDCRYNYEDKGKCFSFKIRPPGIDYKKDKSTTTNIVYSEDDENRGVNAENYF